MSCKPREIPLCIEQGSTFSYVLRWGQPRLAYRQISAASKAAPCVLTTSADHDLPDGWPFMITGCKGMQELNDRAQAEDPDERYYEATVLGDDSIELNDVNAADFGTYTGGGIITYSIPVDLDGYTARAQIRESVGSSEILLELTTTNGRIVLDNTAKTITLQITATDTADLDWTTGVYALELVSAGGVVSCLARGKVRVGPEITR